MDGTIGIDRYRELYNKEGYPSMRDSFCEGPYPEKRLVLAYLVHGGHEELSAPRMCRDCFTNEVFQLGEGIRTDGKYHWSDRLAYYVERYNLRPPEEFVRKAVEANFPNTCNRSPYRCDARKRR